MFFLPAAAHTEKSGTFTNTQRMLQWHHKAVEPPGDATSDLWFYYHLGQRIRAKLAGSTDADGPAAARPDLGLPGAGTATARARAPRRCCARSTAPAPDGAALSAYTELKDDGSTTLRLLDLLRRVRRRGQPGGPAQARPASSPGSRRSGAGPGRPTGGSSTTAPRPTPTASRGASGRPTSGGTPSSGRWTGHDVPDFIPDRRAGPRAGRRAPRGRTRSAAPDPFVMQTDGKGWLFAPDRAGRRPAADVLRAAGVAGPQPALRAAEQPGRAAHRPRVNPSNPSQSEVFPFVFTSYRLTEHHTAGGMSRTLPFLSELQPEFFCEVSPRAGRASAGWRTAAGRRS